MPDACSVFLMALRSMAPLPDPEHLSITLKDAMTARESEDGWRADPALQAGDDVP